MGRPGSSSGYRSLLRWARELGEPAFAVEGTGSYGAGLVRFLEQAGVPAYECERPRRQENAGGAKRSDRRRPGRGDSC